MIFTIISLTVGSRQDGGGGKNVRNALALSFLHKTI
jgi:hypothetical protein